jgi:DNA/RNA endonuclease YhcR with UshA esterase domain
MKKFMKILGIVTVIGIVVGGIAAWYIWNKPHPDARKEKGLVINADQLVKEFTTNEQVANKKYLDKALSVKGEIIDIGANQDSSTTVTLRSSSEMTNVYCTLQKGEPVPDTGEVITIKGFCIGLLSDVTIKDAVIDK